MKQEPTVSVELGAINFTSPPVSHDVEENINQDIPIDDVTPSIIEQAKSNGWKCSYYSFGKQDGQGTEFFNPAIVGRNDGPWLITRASGFHPQGFMYGQNAIIAFKLDDACKQPCYGKVISWATEKTEPQQHFEDPRGFYHPAIGQTLIGCCTFLWHGPGDWSGPHQALGAFDEEWNCKKMDYPRIGGNPGTMEKIKAHKDYEKNWLWFLLEDGRLAMLYKANPWKMLVFGNRWSEYEEIKLPGVTWPYGEIRGGTTPVRVGDLYFTFHHSSLPWKGRYRRYYAGCLAFDAKPPFTPRLITSEPLLIGSQNDRWSQRKPLVVFPCGALYKNESWLITMGVNDLVAAWLELPHKDLFARMVPVEEVSDPIFTDYALPKEKPILSGVAAEGNPQIREPLRTPAQKPCTVPNGGRVEHSTGFDISFHSKRPRKSKKKRKPFSPEALANLRAAAAKARAARMLKRNGGDATCNTTSTVNVGTVNSPRGEDRVYSADTERPIRRRRRRKRFKRVTPEARQKALSEYEAKNSVATPENI